MVGHVSKLILSWTLASEGSAVAPNPWKDMTYTDIQLHEPSLVGEPFVCDSFWNNIDLEMEMRSTAGLPMLFLLLKTFADSPPSHLVDDDDCGRIRIRIGGVPSVTGWSIDRICRRRPFDDLEFAVKLDLPMGGFEQFIQAVRRAHILRYCQRY